MRRGDGRRSGRAWRLAWLCVGLAALGVAGYLAYRAVADVPGQRFPDQGHRHIQAAETPHEAYNTDPPTSGAHLPYLAPWGVHTRPIPPELQVHNLEDGGVLVQYSCACPEIVERLGAIVSRYDRHVILAPYPSMRARIALTAWTRLDTLDEVDERRIVRFIEAYRGVDHHAR